MRVYTLAQFDTPALLVAATRQVHEKGFAELDTYSPYPVHGTSEAMGLKRSRVPLIALIGGLTGASGGYLMQWYCNAVNWPINIGNRLPHSPPAFIPITFELGILIAALSIFFGLMALSGMPRPHHPVFEVEEFRSASTHAFWLSVVTDSPEVRQVLSDDLVKLGASHVAHVDEDPPGSHA